MIELEYVKLVINIEKYKYYKRYVEPLEKEYDELLDEYFELKNENKSLKIKIGHLLNKEDVLTESDAQRYRKQAIMYKKQRDELRRKLNEKTKH